MTKELAATSRVSLYLPLERKTRKPKQMQFKAEMPGRNFGAFSPEVVLVPVGE